MSVEWKLPQDDSPGSLRSFGRELRSRYGGIDRTMDARMAELLRLLDHIPSVPAPRRGAGETHR